MYDESFNTGSFSKRASPNKNRLPSSFPSNIFCHTCQTNQTLIVNMLSNYLPPSSDPSYSKLLAEYPAYKASLHARYPPVCARCQPAVNEQIGQKDTMARSSALGGWLEASNRRDGLSSAHMGASSPYVSGQASRSQIVAWNIRGAMWVCNLVWWIYVGVAGSITYPNSPPGPIRSSIWLILPSILWQFWDPTWRTLQRAHFQGREVRIEGKHVWVRCQGLSWIARLLLCVVILLRPIEVPRAVFACIVPFEFTINLVAFRSLHVIRPPRIKLIASSRIGASATTSNFNNISSAPPLQSPPEVPALSALSLSPISSSRPTRSVNPIFGVASLAQPPIQLQPHVYSEGHDPDAMDWSPANESTRQDNTDWLRPPRFAPEKPTGLEGLLEKFGIAGDEGQEAKPNDQRAEHTAGVGSGIFIGVVVGIGAVAIATGLAVWPLGWKTALRSS